MIKRSRHNRRNTPLSRSLLLLAGLVLPSVGYSLTFTVTDGGDGFDANPGNGVCASSIGGFCTLRAAIQEANASPGLDTILLQTDASLSRSGTFENAGKDGDLDITDSLIIEGSNATRTVNAFSNDRVFHIQNGAKVTLRNLKITGGLLNISSTTIVPKGQLPGGAGILVEGASTLNLENVNLTANELVGSTSFILTGGGLYVDALAKVYIKDSKIQDNKGPGGGGITNLGHIEIRNSTISGNTGGNSNGGGIRNMGGYLNVGNSTITNNTANMGAGFASSDLGLNLGNVIVSNSVIKLNRATQYGGGIHNESPVTLTNSTVSNNSSGYDGGGIYNSALGNMDIINSTISTNDGRSGGGIFNTRGVTLTNVTLYNNRATPCAVADCGLNGSVGGNQLAVFGGDAGSSPGVTIANTIIADGANSSSATTACSGLIAPTNYKGLIRSSGGNLENGDSCGLVPTRTIAPDIINSNNLGLDPNLAIDPKFLDTTPVHALLNGSGAIDHANGSLCPQVDQRFLSRTDGRCDIGAYEFGASISQQNTMVDLKLAISDSADPVKPNDALSPLTYRIVLTNLYVNASANGVLLTIKLPNEFTFTKIETTSTTEQPDCDKTPNAQRVIECTMVTLPGLGRVEVFVTGYATVDGVTMTTEAGVSSQTQDSFLGNNRVTELTVVDKNASTTLNFGGLGSSSGGGGGGTLHPWWLLTLGGLLLARRQRRH